MELPSQEEQQLVARYVLKRELYRPKTSYKRAAMFVCLYLAGSLCGAFASSYLLDRLGIFLLLPQPIRSFDAAHPWLFLCLYVFLFCCVVGLFCLKSAMIGMIRLYQHYAPEEIRRRCLFKPTCSEYAILAIKKYGVIIGLFKAYIRLFKKCRGTIYRIDYP